MDVHSITANNVLGLRREPPTTHKQHDNGPGSSRAVSDWTTLGEQKQGIELSWSHYVVVEVIVIYTYV